MSGESFPPGGQVWFIGAGDGIDDRKETSKLVARRCRLLRESVGRIGAEERRGARCGC
jgi:hypothetical protein